MNKVPYKEFLPSVDDILNSPKDYKCLSFFSGIGGGTMGMRLAGLDVLFANEFIEIARDNYKKNWPTPISMSDIRKLKANKILDFVSKYHKKEIKKGDIDILEASPPCKAYSSAGVKEKNWGKEVLYSENVRQRVDDLFKETCRLIYNIQPKTFMIENVKGLTQGKSKVFFGKILCLLSKLGYEVDYQILNSANYGTPQKRERCIIIGVRNDLGISPIFPQTIFEEDNWYSVKEAFSNLEYDINEVRFLENCMAKYKIGQQLKELKMPGEQHEKRFSLVRNWWHKPSRTLCAKDGDLSAASAVHPFYDRKHTIGEIKRLAGVPDDLILLGHPDNPLKNYYRKYERIGRIHAPLQVKAVMKTIKEEILNKI